MHQAKARSAILSGSADEIEASFYEALQTGNIEQLMACWADEEEIVCVHPGGPRHVGAAQIRASFQALFDSGVIQAWPERICKLESLGCWVHNVIERIAVLTPGGPAQAFVVATNVYLKTSQGWRLAAHHASPGTESDVAAMMATPEQLH